MATSTIKNTTTQVINVINKITFTDTNAINFSYTYFYKYGRIIYFQIAFNTSLTDQKKIATVDASISPIGNQYWLIIANASGGSSYARLNIKSDGWYIVTPNASVGSGAFVSGYYICNE